MLCKEIHRRIKVSRRAAATLLFLTQFVVDALFLCEKWSPRTPPTYFACASKFMFYGLVYEQK